MFSKDFLRRKFSEEYSRHYAVEVFAREGFQRYVCPLCGKGYWSVVERENCGDSTHAPYSFIRDNPRTETYAGMWKRFAEFWRKNGHEIIPRYPVISRWRDDLYFTIASIVDFQRLENGKTVFEYPANPLVVPQMCLRFNDIANVGVTGRHFSCFMMAGQHSFNCDREGYWKDECMRLNYDFLTQVMGIPKEEITYGEDVWSIPDFSSFGPSIESFARGSELVNSVFTEFRRVEGDVMEPLDMKVIDVGWGFERLLWYYNGSPSAYDAVFPREMAFMEKRSGFSPERELMGRYSRMASGLDVESVRDLAGEKRKIADALGISVTEMETSIAPMQAMYAIADHSRALLFSLTDGGLPSNAAGGYNLRVLLRRAFSFMDEHSLNFELAELMELQARELKPLFPELGENMAGIGEILSFEKKKFADTMSKARRLAEQVVSRGKQLSEKEMATLYESNGVTPEIIAKAARELGKEIAVSSSFYRAITEKHVMAEKEKKEYAAEFSDLPSTVLLYYARPLEVEATATVLRVRGNKVALDQTIFYPEGGGQAADKGFIGGREVSFAEKIGGVVVHHLADAGGVEEGSRIRLVLSWDRREALMRHHSATHVIIQCARRVLGNHVWQAGSRKEEDEAHVDITHYARLTEAQRKEIERMANDAVLRGIPIRSIEMDRGAAEKQYGFRLYQGGGAIGRKIRVVEVAGFDVQACGGVHLSNTSKIGFIKIIGSEGIQDGVVRLRYVAGPKALNWVHRQDDLVSRASSAIEVPPSHLEPEVRKIFGEWRQRGKDLEAAYDRLAASLAREAVAEARAAGKKIIDFKGDADVSSKVLEKIALNVAKEQGLCCVAVGSDGSIVAACSDSAAESALSLIQARGAKGGGSRSFARGKA